MSSSENSTIQLRLTTEAIGIGVDILDIRPVVLNGFPIDYDPAIGGRGGRHGKESEIILLLEE